MLGRLAIALLWTSCEFYVSLAGPLISIHQGRLLSLLVPKVPTVVNVDDGSPGEWAEEYEVKQHLHIPFHAARSKVMDRQSMLSGTLYGKFLKDALLSRYERAISDS